MANYCKNYWRERSATYEKVGWVKNNELLSVLLGFLPDYCQTILDLGVGTGAFANIVSKNSYKVYGLDISLDMMTNVSDEVLKIQGDVQFLPFRANSIDCVVMRNVLHYIQDKERTTREIYDVVKNDGYFLFSQVVPFSDEISSEYDWLIGRNIHYPTINEVKSLYSIFNIEDITEIVLPSQSILNWLNNTKKSKKEKEEVLQRHHDTSKRYKSLVNYRENEKDIFVDMKHVSMKMKKF